MAAPLRAKKIGGEHDAHRPGGDRSSCGHNRGDARRTADFAAAARSPLSVRCQRVLRLQEPVPHTLRPAAVTRPVASYFFLLYSEHQPFGLIAPSTTAQLPGA